ncbi:hypothetical protein GCM10023084_02630 [Streptomyces lacrimifluminis]|uniref:hypothetical protein n=1 Tax=Streptomyces lacrimifluminis TaxID=1500077 RepID=UPI0031E5B72E
MSTVTACWLIAAVLFPVGLLLLALGLCRVGGQASRAEEAREETTHDVGPDPLRLMQDLDAHLDAHAAQLAGLYERLGPPGPEWDAGCERLWDAVRDHQKGDQA